MELKEILRRVRANTGVIKDGRYLTAERTLGAVNHIYTKTIPNQINWDKLQDWVYIPMADGDDGTYPFDTKIYDQESGGVVIGTRVNEIEPPFLLIVDSDRTTKLDYTDDWEEFWTKFPPITNETENQPGYILRRARKLWVRPIPDDSYTGKVWAKIKPVALSASDDEPTEDWAEAIIAGASAMLLEDHEEHTAAAKDWWGKFAGRLDTDTTGEQWKPQTRIQPRF